MQTILSCYPLKVGTDNLKTGSKNSKSISPGLELEKVENHWVIGNTIFFFIFQHPTGPHQIQPSHPNVFVHNLYCIVLRLANVLSKFNRQKTRKSWI